MRSVIVVHIALLAACGGEVSGTRHANSSVPIAGVGTPCDPDLPSDSDDPASAGDDDEQPTPDDDAPTPAIVPVVAGGYGTLDPAYQRLHGPGLFTIDTLWEINLGRGTSATASQRFRAPVAGTIASLKQYFWGSPGYSAGAGGVVRLRVYPDDGSSLHAPNMSGTPLATGTFTPSMSGGSFTDTHQAFEAVAMSSDAPLIAGELYHVVYSNDVNTESTFISLDLSASNLPKHGRANRWLAPSEWAVLRRSSQTGNVWQDITANDHYNGRAYFNPILQVTMSSGAVFGSSPVETGATATYVVQASATNPIRERITPSETRVVTAISVHTAAEVGGSLVWELRHGTDVVASGTLSQPQANYSIDTTIQSDREQGNVVWYDSALEAPVALAAGQTYDLVFTPQGASLWRFINQRNGRSYGYVWGAGSMYESYAQHTRNGQWRNTYYYDLDQNGPQGDSNWPVVLHTR